MALRVLASLFHTDAATEARGRFTEAAFIKPTIGPRHPSGSEQRGKGGADGWQHYGFLCRGADSEEGKGSGGSDGTHSQMRSQMWAASSLVDVRLQELLGTKDVFPSHRVCGRLTTEMALILHPSHIMSNVIW